MAKKNSANKAIKKSAKKKTAKKKVKLSPAKKKAKEAAARKKAKEHAEALRRRLDYLNSPESIFDMLDQNEALMEEHLEHSAPGSEAAKNSQFALNHLRCLRDQYRDGENIVWIIRNAMNLGIHGTKSKACLIASNNAKNRRKLKDEADYEFTETTYRGFLEDSGKPYSAAAQTNRLLKQHDIETVSDQYLVDTFSN